jgi:hypothetical protein
MVRSVGAVAEVGVPIRLEQLHFGRFFANIYEQYDVRFVYGAANLPTKTRRLA